MQQGLKSEGTNKSKSSEGIKKVSSVQVEVSKEEEASGRADGEGETDTEDDEVHKCSSCQIIGQSYLSLSPPPTPPLSLSFFPPPLFLPLSLSLSTFFTNERLTFQVLLWPEQVKRTVS